MTEMQLLERIERTFSKVFGRQVPFDPELTRAAERRWTSLKHVELMVALENEFDLRFDGADATDMNSIELVARRVREKLT